MKIWIDDIQGYLDGYSTMEQPNKIELEVKNQQILIIAGTEQA